MKRKIWIKRNTMYLAISVLISLFMFAQTSYSDNESCIYCGMKKPKFEHSWVIVEHEDGSKCGTCSVHCAAIDIALHTDKPVKKITVGDYNTKNQIDADKAFWVIGGDKMGVMTARAKWAFKTKEAADSFMKEHGGRPATFNEAMKAAFEDMYSDVLMIQKKRQMMKMKKE